MTSLRTCTGRSRTGCNGVGVHKSHKSREHSITGVFFFSFLPLRKHRFATGDLARRVSRVNEWRLVRVFKQTQ